MVCSEKSVLVEAYCITDDLDIEKHKILLPNPVAGSIKITNGKLWCKVIMHDNGVEVLVKDKDGNTKRFEFKKEDTF